MTQPSTWTAVRSADDVAGRGSVAAPNLADVHERVLDKGMIIAGDIKINLLDIELLTIKLQLLVASLDKAKEIGIDWWEHDPSSNGPPTPMRSHAHFTRRTCGVFAASTARLFTSSTTASSSPSSARCRDAAHRRRAVPQCTRSARRPRRGRRQDLQRRRRVVADVGRKRRRRPLRRVCRRLSPLPAPGAASNCTIETTHAAASPPPQPESATRSLGCPSTTGTTVRRTLACPA
jgi:Gas vesicle protein